MHCPVAALLTPGIEIGAKSGSSLLAQQQANYAVSRVSAMEDPSCIGDVPYLVLYFVKDCKFVSSHEMRLASYDDSATKERAITNKKCLAYFAREFF